MEENYKEMYLNLLNRYEELQVEIVTLKRLVGLIPSNIQSFEMMKTFVPKIAKIEKQESQINKFSRPNEKIALFMSLFRGREDVFARRWYSEKSGKSSYSPVCANEWVNGVCIKLSKKKCKDCSSRSLVTLSKKHIEGHLRGEEVLGVYPLTEDECCYFLVVDFDKGDWYKDVQAFWETCEKNSFPVYIERSRSGNGAHAWFFFTDKVEASIARKFGNGLLTHTMNRRHELKLSSYDRLLPNQDKTPLGGFGNLIALPLQGHARQNDNSVFVDSEFYPYPDQWALLATIEKITPNQVKVFSELLGDSGELGCLHEEKPWENQKKQIEVLSKSDFPKRVKLVYANGIYIEKVGISSRALNQIKRLAAFSNPAFFKAQNLRLSTHNIPRIIDCSKNYQNYIRIPRGCLNDLNGLLKEVECEIDDKTCGGNPIKVDFKGELRQEQKPAVEALLSHENGILWATTAFGKTVIAANIIGNRKVNTLILVHSSALMNQWKKSLEEFLDFHDPLPEPVKKRGRKQKQSHIGLLGSGKKALSGQVDIGMMQSILSNEESLNHYGMVIIDECHHIPAVTFERILQKVNAKYIYGLTATLKRKDGLHPIIQMQCGPVRYQVDALNQAKKRNFKHLMIPRFTNFKLPQHVEESDLNISTAYQSLIENEGRNHRIIEDIKTAIEEGRHPIVITQRVSHIELLANALKESCPNVIKLTGKLGNKEKNLGTERLHSLRKDDSFVIIATGKYIGEGFDYPRLDTLFLVMPISWKGILHQYAGRLHREYEGKNEVIIYDYVDVHVKMFEKMYHNRVKGYASIGYEAKAEGGIAEKVGVLFDNQNFLSILKTDFEKAKYQIIIVSPFVRKGRIKNLDRVFSEVLLKVKNITVITKAITDYKTIEQDAILESLNILESMGIEVIQKSGIHQKFIIIDEHLVWYGSINFLSYGRSEESVMRLDNREIADELMKIMYE